MSELIRLDVAPDRPREAAPRLTFDLLSSRDGPVSTGHHDGVVTIDLAEADDAHRAQVQRDLAEPYRTLVGHFRHELGHYYWPILTASRLADVIALFGDHERDYSAALRAHYRSRGFDADRHLSSYAAAHPWEDWAETFAHVLHIRATLETAHWYGARFVGPLVDHKLGDLLASAPVPPTADTGLQALLPSWQALVFTLNAINRSMGRPDLYPFVLSKTVIDKLELVDELLLASRRPESPRG